MKLTHLSGPDPLRRSGNPRRADDVGGERTASAMSTPAPLMSSPRTHGDADVFAAAHSTAAVETNRAAVALPTLSPRRLPPLREALADPHLPAADFSSIDVPPHVMNAIGNAKRILVVGHVPPDGDCVGSAAGLAAALCAVGKDAVAVVDDALPAACRAIDAGHRVKRAEDIDGTYDLVILVDVAQAHRVAGAKDALAAAARVVVIDHHQDDPTHESLGLSPKQELTTWIDSRADAAAILVGGIAARLGNAALFEARAMLAASIYTDTLGFRAPGVDTLSVQLFKGIVDSNEALDALEASLRPVLPPAAAAIASSIPESTGPHGSLLRVDAETWAALGAAARSADPLMTDGDLRGFLCDRLDALRDLNGVSCMAIEEPGGVRVSTRSVRDGVAARVAETLGGGGHGRSAGGFVDRPLAEVVDTLTAAMKSAGLAQEARLRTGRL